MLAKLSSQETYYSCLMAF